MICLHCQADLSVSNSRPQKSRNQVWRRRPCKACGAIYTSIEALDLSQALTVAINGVSQPFDRDRLYLSLHTSLRHRQTAVADARGLVDTIIKQITKLSPDTCIQGQTIISVSSTALRRFDAAAASHYVAFHRASRTSK